MASLYLASSSPRRSELLQQIGVPFTLSLAPIDETPLATESPSSYVRRLALAKAQAALAVLPSRDAVVLGADTAVVLDQQILGKPVDRADALATLRRLSGREHQVLSAIAVISAQRSEVRVVSTRVTFRVLADAEIEAYWASGEPCDKAGSYGIQGLGGVFVSQLTGSYSAVVGLPLCETGEMLADFGIACWQNS